MPNRRAAIAMTPDEISAFLAAGRILILVTTGPDGVGDPVPMWYEMDDQGRVCMRTYARSQKVANLRRDPRFSAVVEDGERYSELRGVQLTGRVELIEDQAWIADLYVRLLTKYEGLNPRHALALREAAHERAAKQVGLRLLPERIASWDHGKEAGE
ncbi:MAG TPA: pyridoxamine 5'-phosphate oxidase family protein [Mycobacteriales bacterium]|jgi:Pyridoxamine 5''-phosphate oxidase.